MDHSESWHLDCEENKGQHVWLSQTRFLQGLREGVGNLSGLGLVTFFSNHEGYALQEGTSPPSSTMWEITVLIS